uniref:Uncharacterized protein n=1 Tax=uncultured marine virus TaxID=186617 RepID=A0A0F7LAA9_9VIRU|nr:hypothetical protein [uncultured marine virus]
MHTSAPCLGVSIAVDLTSARTQRTAWCMSLATAATAALPLFRLEKFVEFEFVNLPAEPLRLLVIALAADGAVGVPGQGLRVVAPELVAVEGFARRPQALECPLCLDSGGEPDPLELGPELRLSQGVVTGFLADRQNLPGLVLQ